MIWFRILHVMISQYNWIECDNKGKDDDCNISKCNVCNEKSADIFQVEGEYCLECWQKRTYPNL